MRSTVVSLAVIALALAAILAGYLNGQAGTRPPPVVQLHQGRPMEGRSLQYADDPPGDAADDLFSQDQVVIERPAQDVSWQPERLSFVVGLVGTSTALDSTFLRLGVPLAFDLDPNAGDAVDVAHLVHDEGDMLLIHEDHALSSEGLAALRARFSQFDGIASRDAKGQAASLAGTGLSYFDERGDADPAPFAAARVPFIARDATVDDRSERSYISFMLDRVADRSVRQGRLVVLIRPQPNSLSVLDTFTRTRSAQIVALTAQ